MAPTGEPYSDLFRRAAAEGRERDLEKRKLEQASQEEEQKKLDEEKKKLEENPVMGLLMLLFMGARAAKTPDPSKPDSDPEKTKQSEEALSLFDKLFPVIEAEALAEAKTNPESGNERLRELAEVKRLREPSHM